jgi:hypothetical protein
VTDPERDNDPLHPAAAHGPRTSRHQNHPQTWRSRLEPPPGRTTRVETVPERGTPADARTQTDAPPGTNAGFADLHVRSLRPHISLSMASPRSHFHGDVRRVVRSVRGQGAERSTVGAFGGPKESPTMDIPPPSAAPDPYSGAVPHRGRGGQVSSARQSRRPPAWCAVRHGPARHVGKRPGVPTATRTG